MVFLPCDVMVQKNNLTIVLYESAMVQSSVGFIFIALLLLLLLQCEISNSGPVHARKAFHY